ncbi:hypothetical protein [Halalkalicoccus salilacus]|uniref:hypothetical protein n=1 Tax=Halalkalicoccus salilacus TaxID=3117459 RepID=UPI00300E866E
MTFRDQRKRLKRIMAKRDGQLPALSDELVETLITEWDDLTFLTEGGKATLETDGGDRAPVPWIRAAYVYIPSEDSIYSTDPRKLWALGLSGESALGIYENPLYADVGADADDELPS